MGQAVLRTTTRPTAVSISHITAKPVTVLPVSKPRSPISPSVPGALPERVRRDRRRSTAQTPAMIEPTINATAKPLMKPPKKLLIEPCTAPAKTATAITSTNMAPAGSVRSATPAA